MDLTATIKELSRTLGTPKPRHAFGTWPTYAWVVRGLVERGHGITDAVNHVLDNSGIPNTKQAFGSLRAAYYHIKTAEWPAQMEKTPDVEGFE